MDSRAKRYKENVVLLQSPKAHVELAGISIREGLVSAGKQVPCSSCDLIVQHLLASVTLQYTRDGLAQSIRALPDDIHIIPAGRTGSFEFNQSPNLFVLSFDHRKSDTTATSASELKLHLCLRDFQISSLVHVVRDEIRSNCIRGQSYLSQLCSLLLRYVYSTYSRDAVPKGALAGLPPRRLRLVLQYIHAHLRERLIVRDLAKLVQMSPQHFGNLFRQSTGYSAYSYILHHRIEQGKRLLAETKLPIMEIALEVGFAHHSHFGDTFRQLTGIAPKQYRRQFENLPPE